ncbi:biopolymer transporter ExbD [Opitutia bacterium ISCC 51]|nr:biopolymer transporter ExbD [Opitutae bacterium ISCC 51]QXD28266.1 biopolymer transporter ExbD [Opitutae bacterium ISCC 52]
MIKRRKRQQPEEEFQMAPMIDMVFLLLVFFMCVSSLSQAEKPDAVKELPESHASEVPDDVSDRGIISVKTDGSLYLGPSSITMEDLKTRIGGKIKDNPNLQIFVRADKATPFAEIKKILEACAEMGAYEVIYATFQASE